MRVYCDFSWGADFDTFIESMKLTYLPKESRTVDNKLHVRLSLENALL